MATTRRTSISPRTSGRELEEEGRITEHPVFPGRVGPAARRINTDDDVRDVIVLLRLNYDRMTEARAATAAA